MFWPDVYILIVTFTKKSVDFLHCRNINMSKTIKHCYDRGLKSCSYYSCLTGYCLFLYNEIKALLANILIYLDLYK